MSVVFKRRNFSLRTDTQITFSLHFTPLYSNVQWVPRCSENKLELWKSELTKFLPHEIKCFHSSFIWQWFYFFHNRCKTVLIVIWLILLISFLGCLTIKGSPGTSKYPVYLTRVMYIPYLLTGITFYWGRGLGHMSLPWTMHLAISAYVFTRIRDGLWWWHYIVYIVLTLLCFHH